MSKNYKIQFCHIPLIIIFHKKSRQMHSGTFKHLTILLNIRKNPFNSKAEHF